MAARTTFDGVSLAEARRIVDYEFSNALIKIERDVKNQNYEVHIIDTIEKKTIEKFKAYYKNNFRIKVYSLKYEL